LRSYRGISLSR